MSFISRFLLAMNLSIIRVDELAQKHVEADDAAKKAARFSFLPEDDKKGNAFCEQIVQCRRLNMLHDSEGTSYNSRNIYNLVQLAIKGEQHRRIYRADSDATQSYDGSQRGIEFKKKQADLKHTDRQEELTGNIKHEDIDAVISERRKERINHVHFEDEQEDITTDKQTSNPCKANTESEEIGFNAVLRTPVLRTHVQTRPMPYFVVVGDKQAGDPIARTARSINAAQTLSRSRSFSDQLRNRSKYSLQRRSTHSSLQSQSSQEIAKQHVDNKVSRSQSFSHRVTSQSEESSEQTMHRMRRSGGETSTSRGGGGSALQPLRRDGRNKSTSNDSVIMGFYPDKLADDLSAETLPPDSANADINTAGIRGTLSKQNSKKVSHSEHTTHIKKGTAPRYIGPDHGTCTSHRSRALLEGKLSTSLLSLPTISAEEQRKAIGTPRFERKLEKKSSKLPNLPGENINVQIRMNTGNISLDTTTVGSDPACEDTYYRPTSNFTGKDKLSEGRTAIDIPKVNFNLEDEARSKSWYKIGKSNQQTQRRILNSHSIPDMINSGNYSPKCLRTTHEMNIKKRLFDTAHGVNYRIFENPWQGGESIATESNDEVALGRSEFGRANTKLADGSVSEDYGFTSRKDPPPSLRSVKKNSDCQQSITHHSIGVSYFNMIPPGFHTGKENGYRMAMSVASSKTVPQESIDASFKL